jgi:hypothetical protein
MGRLLAFLLGGAALALYGPHLFMSHDALADYKRWWVENLFGGGPDAEGWYQKIFVHGPGIFAGLALLLLAVRGRDS